MTRRIISVAVFSILSFASVLAAQRYVLVDLGRGEGTFAWPTDINEKGDVVGYVSGPPFGWAAPVVWSGGAMTTLDSSGYPEGYPGGINESRQIAGTLSAGKTIHAVLWTEGDPRILEPPGTFGEAGDVNDSGEVAGAYRVPQSAQFVPFRWAQGVLTPLGTFGSSPNHPVAINNAGDIVGYTANPQLVPLHWRGTEVAALALLPGGTFGHANAINDDGVIAGYSRTLLATGASVTHAVRWEAGVPADLGSLASQSFANGINSGGDIVGDSVVAPGGFHGALWKDGVLSDLNGLIDEAGGCVIAGAAAINDRGQIAARGRCPSDAPGQQRVFRLDPRVLTPEERIAALRGVLDGLSPTPGLMTSFGAKIDAALASLARGSSAAACNQLDALANAIAAQSGKALSAPGAQAILDEIAAIRSQLGCS